MMNKVSYIGNGLALLVLGASIEALQAAELPVQIQYPTQAKNYYLTELDGDLVGFRPPGHDSGGRAYLEIEQLELARARLNFLLPEEYLNAVQELETQGAVQALPTIRKHTDPFMEYLPLSGLPGNMVQVLITYIDVLSASGQWTEAVDVAGRLPYSIAPPLLINRVTELAEDLYLEGQSQNLQRLHKKLLASGSLSTEHLEVLMELAGFYRDNESYRESIELYDKVQREEGPLQPLAQLWLAYCRINLGEAVEGEQLLEDLPRLENTDPAFSLRELVRALVFMSEGDSFKAMRSAATGKTYANTAQSWYPELLFQIASLYNELGQMHASEFAYRELSTLYPETRWGKKSLSILETMNL